MTRFYFSTPVDITKRIWKGGFWDMQMEFGRLGVLFTDIPLDARDESTVVTLCIELPDEIFSRYEFDDPDHDHQYREALIPSVILNKLEKLQIYDYTYAGFSRREMKQCAVRWKRDGVDGFRHAEELGAAMAFLDEIGWLTPLRLREQTNPR